MARSWYILRTRHELQARDDLAELGFYAYVPLERVERRLGRTLQAFERPVWRGYVFVLCEPSQFGAVMMVKGAQDLVRYVSEFELDGEAFPTMAPVALKLDALDLIIHAEAIGELDYMPTVYTPQHGDAVMIRSGKWKGYLGRIVSIAKHKAIVETQWCKLEIEPEHLEAAA